VLSRFHGLGCECPCKSLAIVTDESVTDPGGSPLQVATHEMTDAELLKISGAKISEPPQIAAENLAADEPEGAWDDQAGTPDPQP